MIKNKKLLLLIGACLVLLISVAYLSFKNYQETQVLDVNGEDIYDELLLKN
ncbi:hypothetical protein [Natroniella sp. ANB-PHB2]|uniref:hypothetical protein n=1 Tax=Natroniella sp. ANB-PHB2 TaxID=3384444 RepID=UPI0038D48982